MDHTSSPRTHPDQASPPGAVVRGEPVTDDQVSGCWAAAETAEGRVCVRLLEPDPAGTRVVCYARLTGASADLDWRPAIARALARHRRAAPGQRWQVWSGRAWEDLPAFGPTNPATATRARATEREVVVFGATEQQFRGLEAALGLPEFGLGRYKPWAAPSGVHLDGDRYEVDAAIRFAEAHGLAYEQTVTTRYEAHPTHAATGTGDQVRRP
jgi:hypothetical protein